uniref:COMM domain-containing protein 2 n=1 Tax=Ciona intestinalis TaxID=7719 RepID=F6TCG6_CIOIN|nr:COMM domain-containing protein 2 [Ciona intestinalis]|eukprot:XP_002126073.1 COMM domain-containing protein 2 [Ciona intestinalis]
MLLKLSSENIEHLSFLRELDDDIVQEFASLAIQFLTNGIKSKIFRVAAQKLAADPKVVEDAVMGLMQLFSEAAKHKTKAEDFHNSLLTLQFKDSTVELLRQVFVDHNNTTRATLAQCSPTLPTYEDLEWRLDVKVATRSLHQQIEPRILLKLHTKNGDHNDSKLLQTDPVNLINMTRVLEEALNEMKTKHVRRVLRNIT